MKLLLLLAALWGAPAQAVISDTTIGNGGDVVSVGGEAGPRYYLLDLFETGASQAPYFDESITVPSEIIERAKRAISEPAAALVARKLAEIAGRDRLLGYSLLRAMELLRWKFVSYPLKNVPDEGTVYDGMLFQAAIRQGNTIFIQSDLWAQMADDRQRAALVLHELIYALYAPEKWKSDQKVQRSYRVREINSYLFDEKWRRFSGEEFYRIVNARLPTSADSGVKVESDDASSFRVAPMLGLIGNIPMPNNVASEAIVALRSKRAGEIYEKERIDSLCQDFSSPVGVHSKGEIYRVALLNLPVTLRREAYNSPLGILDYIDWGGDREEGLPPYGQRRSSYPRLFTGENFRELKSQVIFDFSKYSYSPRVAEKAKLACLNFLHGAMKEFGLLLDEYQ